jgi:hypothetical protein
LNSSATAKSATTGNIGGSGWGGASNHGMTTQNCSSTQALVGVVAHKQANGYVSGWQLICGTLPGGTSRVTGSDVFGWSNAGTSSPWQRETIECPTGMVAVGMFAYVGSIMDRIGLRCGTITGATQATVTINNSATGGTFGSTIALSATGGTGAGAFSYAVTTAGSAGCSVSGATLSATAAGTCTVTATKAGDANYAAASSSATTITFNKANQTISFADPGTKERATTPFASGATVSSGQTASLSSSTTSVCTTSGLDITMVTTGTCTIVASQSGNGNYNAATDVTHSFTIQDTTPPVMTVSSNPSTLASGASSTITFSSTESTTTFSASDVSATLGTLSGFSGSGTTYTATFTASPTSGGTAVITIASGSFTDSAGNANASAQTGSVTVTNTTASTGGRSN